MFKSNHQGFSFLRGLSVICLISFFTLVLTLSITKIDAPQTDQSSRILSAPATTAPPSCPVSYSRTAYCPEYSRDRNPNDKCQRYDECRVETIRLMDGTTCSRTVVTYHPVPSDCNSN